MSQRLPGSEQIPRLKFYFVDGPRVGERVEVTAPVLNGPPVFIGRSRECQICIETGDVSRKHAEITLAPNGHLLIRDNDSVNGTFINERPVLKNAPTPFYPGDKLKVGNSDLIFEGLVAPVASRSQPLTNPKVPNQVPLVPQATAQVEAAKPAPGEEQYIYIFLRNGQRYRFEGDEAKIGRGQANDIVIENVSISRDHAKIFQTPNGIFVTDLGSTNKTFVNGVAADVPMQLKSGDVLRFGDIEADFKIETHRLSTIFKLSDVLSNLDDTTERDLPTNEQTAFTDFGGETMLDIPSAGLAGAKRNIEEGETNLHIDLNELRVVGRQSRQQTGSAMADNLPITGPLKAQGTGPRSPVGPSRVGAEVARMEGVFFTEGTGRASTQLLKNVWLSLRQGELVALIGPSGSGKSELLQIMAGMLPADRGSVLVLGYQIPTLESWQGRRRLNFEEDRDHLRWRNRSIGYMTSDLNQLNPRLTVLEQLTTVIEQAGVVLDPRQRQDIALRKLYEVGLSTPEIPRLKPADLNRREKQLVVLARALANDPPLLLADEPTGNLPNAAATYVFKLLQNLAATGKTVFMVTNDQHWTRDVTRQIEIYDGEIVGGLV